MNKDSWGTGRDLERVAIITGAGSGIGRAVALALQAAGYSVVLAGRRIADLEQTTAMAGIQGGKIKAVPTDVSQQDSVRALLRGPAMNSEAGHSVQQCRCECSINCNGRLELRPVVPGRERESYRSVSLCPGGNPPDESAAAARRTNY